MRKIALYPYDISNLYLLLYKNLLSFEAEDSFICIAPSGWGYADEDAGYKVGIDTGIPVISDFEEAIRDVDTLLITESIFPISDKDIMRKIKSALDKGIEVIVIRAGGASFADELNTMARKNNNLGLYMGNGFDIQKDAESKNLGMDEVPAPIILVIGAGERCCKFDIQLELRNTLLENGYAVSQIGSKQCSELFGFHSFPQFMLDNSEYKESEKITGFNKYIQLLYRKENPDVIIIGVPGGVFPFDKEFHNNFGITNFLVSNAVLPDYVIFASLYIDSLKEYLEEVKNRIANKYGYDVDRTFVSNYALDYAASKSENALSYITCKTSAIKNKMDISGIGNIYDSEYKKEAMGHLMNTLQSYAILTVL